MTTSVDVPDFGVAILRGPGHRGDTGPSQALATLSPRSASGEAGGDADRRTFLLLKYGAHGGGHGHPDKLGIILFSHGERLAPDLGTPGYGIALNDAWYRHTLSHNTVLIEGQAQPPATGRLRGFSPLRRHSGRRAPGGAPGLACGMIDAEVEWPATLEAGVYAGAQLRRRIFFRPGYFVDVCTVSCSQPRRLEWAYHNRGTLTHFEVLTGARDGQQLGMATGEPAGDQTGPAPEDQARGQVRGATGEPAGDLTEVEVPATLQLRVALPGQRDVTAAFATGAAGLHLWLQGLTPDAGRAAPGARPSEHSETPGTTSPSDVRPSWVLAAEAPGNPASEPLPLILRRCVGASATFAAVFHPHGGPSAGSAVERPGVRAVSWPRSAGVAGEAGPAAALICEVTTWRGVERWDIPLHGTGAPRLLALP